MKNVVDFTNRPALEIQKYLLEHQGKKICGRFNQTQLNTITIQIPQQLLFSQVHFQKIFLLALLLTMGTSLLSCSDKDGEKKKIDKVEIVADSISSHQTMTLGMLLPPDTLNPDKKAIPPPPSPKIDEVKFVAPDVITRDASVDEKDSLKKDEK